MGLLLAK